MTTNPFTVGARVQFRNILVRRDHPELKTGTITDVHHHTVNVDWDPPRPGAATVAGSYHHTALIEIGATA